MIEIKKRLSERQSLQMTLMGLMVRKHRKQLDQANDMGYQAERTLYVFLQDLGFNRSDFIRSALSPNWPRFLVELKDRKLVPS